MEHYQVVKSKTMYRGKIVNVVQDTIVLPDGREAVREMVLHAGASAVIPIDENGRIVFVRQYRHPAGALVLEIPAGTLEKGEEPYDCAVRELEEETGYKAGKVTFVLKAHTSIGFCTEALYLYLAEDLAPGAQNPDPDEFLTIERYRLGEAVDMVFGGEITDGKTISAIFAYKEILNKQTR